MSRRNSMFGMLLIIIGLALLAARYVLNIEVLHFESGDFWPFIVLFLGIMFEAVYFTTRVKAGFLVPGGILTTLGVLFLFEVATDWRFAEFTWPIYILSVAIGLFQLYIYTNRNKGLMIAVTVLTSAAIISGAIVVLQVFFTSVDIGFVLPLIMIAGGLLVFFGKSSEVGR